MSYLEDINCEIWENIKKMLRLSASSELTLDGIIPFI